MDRDSPAFDEALCNFVDKALRDGDSAYDITLSLVLLGVAVAAMTHVPHDEIQQGVADLLKQAREDHPRTFAPERLN